MPKETKFTLALLFVLGGCLGYIVWQKMEHEKVLLAEVQPLSGSGFPPAHGNPFDEGSANGATKSADNNGPARSPFEEPRRLADPVANPSTPAANPFEGASPNANPFDGVAPDVATQPAVKTSPAVNPFEGKTAEKPLAQELFPAATSASSNPFDAAGIKSQPPASAAQPANKRVNPFDDVVTQPSTPQSKPVVSSAGSGFPTQQTASKSPFPDNLPPPKTKPTPNSSVDSKSSATSHVAGQNPFDAFSAPPANNKPTAAVSPTAPAPMSPFQEAAAQPVAAQPTAAEPTAPAETSPAAPVSNPFKEAGVVSTTPPPIKPNPMDGQKLEAKPDAVTAKAANPFQQVQHSEATAPASKKTAGGFNPFDAADAAADKSGSAGGSSVPVPNGFPVQKPVSPPAEKSPFDGIALPSKPVQPQNPSPEQPAPTSNPRPYNPPGEQKVASEPFPSPGGFDNPVQVDPQQPVRVYTVGEDETYWAISRNVYGTIRYFQALAEHNRHRVGDPKRLRPGMKILVPEAKILDSLYAKIIPGGEQKAVDPAANPSGLFFANNGQPMYRVGEEDTLGDIALKHLGRTSRWIEIYNLNRQALKTPDRLRIGTVLKMPGDASRVAYESDARVIR